MIFCSGVAILTVAACAVSPNTYSPSNDASAIESVRANINARPKANCKGEVSSVVPNSLIRVPPMLPTAARDGGRCTLTFSLNDAGQVSSANVDYCSDPVFRLPTWKMISKWGMAAGTEGESVCGMKQTITYDLRK